MKGTAKLKNVHVGVFMKSGELILHAGNSEEIYCYHAF